MADFSKIFNTIGSVPKKDQEFLDNPDTGMSMEEKNKILMARDLDRLQNPTPEEREEDIKKIEDTGAAVAGMSRPIKSIGKMINAAEILKDTMAARAAGAPIKVLQVPDLAERYAANTAAKAEAEKIAQNLIKQPTTQDYMKHFQENFLPNLKDDSELVKKGLMSQKEFMARKQEGFNKSIQAVNENFSKVGKVLGKK